jgi:hypothetical protein
VALMPEEFATLLIEEPEPPPEPDLPEIVDGDAADVPSEEMADASDTPADERSDRRAPPSSDDRPTLVDREAIRTAALLELGTLMSGDDGPTAVDRLIAGADTTDAAGILAMVDAASSSASAGDVLHERGGASGTPSGDGIGVLSIATHGHHEIATGPVEEREIEVWVNPERPTDEGGTGIFESRLVTARVRAYMAGIRRCYETELRSDPTLAGKVTTKFTILESGSVTGVSTVENTTQSPRLAQCVGGIIGRMRFRQGPEGGSVDFSYPFVFAPQH